MTTVHVIGCMIVKNEERVLKRCLESIKPFVDSFVVFDTGSTDSTIEIALSMPNMTLVQRPWVNFGVNRSEVLDKCAERDTEIKASNPSIVSTWSLMIDADDTIEIVPGLGVEEAVRIFRSELEAVSTEGYSAMCVRILHGGTTEHQRYQLFKNGCGWKYAGAVHEYPECSTPNAKLAFAQQPTSIYMYTRTEGSRSSDPEKYLKDARLLRSEFGGCDPEGNEELCVNTRTCFYLAQSFHNAGRTEAAIRFYKRRAVNGLQNQGYRDEVYVSLHRLISLVKSDDEAVQLAQMAQTHTPQRLEAIHALLFRIRRGGAFNTVAAAKTMALARIAAEVTQNLSSIPQPPPSLLLFVSQTVYIWQFADEFAVMAWLLGLKQLASTAAVVAVDRYRGGERNEETNADFKRLKTNAAMCK